jgi:NADH-quinone oxidoreductase subunit L
VVVLGILTVIGGWLNLPRAITDALPLGRPAILDHWLEPAVGAASARLSAGAREIPASTEQLLMLGAVVIAVAGIAFAVAWLKPARLLPKRDAAAEEGFERVVANKYYVDEGIDATVVRPTYAISKTFLWRVVDAGLIDGLLVNGSAAVARGFGWIGSRLQTGNVGIYAWVLVVGVVALLGAFTLR